MTVFNEIFDDDNYTPIYVETEADYRSILAQFPVKDEEVDKVNIFYFVAV